MGPATEEMDPDLAIGAVDWFGRHAKSAGLSSLPVHFFGGEPFQAPEVVDVAVHHARATAARLGLTARFEVATNGCFDAKRCAFVADYFDTVVLSLDGPEEIHERHRPSRNGSTSFATLARNALALGRSGSRLCLRACITRDTVASLPALTQWFCESFHPSGIVFETLQPTPQSEAAGLEPPDPWQFAVQCARAFVVAASFGTEAIHSASSITEIRHSSCPVGRDSMIVSPDGRVSACYLDQRDWQSQAMDLDFGRFDAPGTLDIHDPQLARIRELTASRGRCRGCLARWHCAGGCHVNHSFPGCPDTYDDFCIQTRLLVVFRLLSELDAHDTLDRLLDDRSSLERIALRSTDLLTDRQDAHA